MDLFHYTTLNVSLQKSSHTLIIEFNNQEKDRFSFEQLFELESILAWASNKIEITTILFTSNTDTFSKGLELKTAENNPEKLERLVSRIRKIGEAILALPQTTIADLKLNASSIGIEFALFCDLRIAHKSSQIQFTHLKEGLTPSCGGIYQLSSLVGYSVAKSWIMTSKIINAQEMYQYGFVTDIYDSSNYHESLNKLLLMIDSQSSISRIQAKMAFYQMSQDQVEKGKKIETQIHKANMVSNDWSESIQAQEENRSPEFMKAKSLTYTISKVKNDLEEILKP